VNRVDVGELADLVLLDPGEEVARGPVIGHQLAARADATPPRRRCGLAALLPGAQFTGKLSEDPECEVRGIIRDTRRARRRPRSLERPDTGPVAHRRDRAHRQMCGGARWPRWLCAPSLKTGASNRTGRAAMTDGRRNVSQTPRPPLPLGSHGRYRRAVLGDPLLIRSRSSLSC
jgi:hypothetical protein